MGMWKMFIDISIFYINLFLSLQNILLEDNTVSVGHLVHKENLI